MKKSMIRERRKRKCIFMIWTLLGLVGLVWLLSLPVSFLKGLFDGEGTVATGKADMVQNSVEPERGALGGSNSREAQSTDDRSRESTEGKGIGAADRDTAVGNADAEKVENADIQNPEGMNNEAIGRGGAVGMAGTATVVPEIGRQDELTMSRCKELYEEYSELLVLVNREHELEEGAYKDTLRNICNGRLQASEYLYEDLVDMLAAAGEAGYQYWIASAYRSRTRQQELVDEDVERYKRQGMSYAEALEKTYEQTMPAGKSEHETGLALDLLCSENVNMDISQADEPGNRWLAEHAHEYGFILRYPKDKEDITGIYYEPWHFRYVGKEAAVFLYEQEWTLEEFWECLRKGWQ